MILGGGDGTDDVHVALSVYALQQTEYLFSLYSYCIFHSDLTWLWVYQWAFWGKATKSLYYTYLTKHNSFHIDDIKLHDLKCKGISTGYLRYMDIYNKEPLKAQTKVSPAQRNPNQLLRLIRQLNLQSLLPPALRHLPPSLPQNTNHLLLICKLRLKLIKLIIQKDKTSNIL